MDFVCGRGFIANGDSYSMADNASYYLYIALWYRTISSFYLWNNNHADMININANGAIGHYWLEEDVGGVQYLLFSLF